MVDLQEFVSRKKKFVVAHRGASEFAKENTLKAFDEAIKHGAHMIECDVQLTGDKKAIAFHDFYLENEVQPVSQLDYAYLISKTKGKNDESIPLLSSVIDLIKDRAYLMLELKLTDTEGFEEDVDTIIKLIESRNISGNILIGSFNYYALHYIRQNYPSYHLAAIKLPGSDELPSEICNKIGFEVFICSIDEINEEISIDAKEHSIYLGVYSIDDKESFDYVKRFDITAYATNNPKLMSSLLDEEDYEINPGSS